MPTTSAVPRRSSIAAPAAAPPIVGAGPPPRWTLRRLVGWVRERFGVRYCRETIRAALRRLDLSWKKAKKRLGRADPEQRQAFVKQVQDLLAGAQRDRYLLVSWDEAHLHQDADLGSGWAPRGQRFWVVSRSPGLQPSSPSMGSLSTTKGRCGCGPIRAPEPAPAKAGGVYTIDALRRLRTEWPDNPIIVLWDGAPYHRAVHVREVAAALHIDLVRLPGYSPDFMPVEELWHWLRGDVTSHYCHPTSDDLRRRVSEFEADINRDPYAVADRLVVKDHLDPEEEKLRFSK